MTERLPSRRVRARLLAEHRETIAATVDAADAVTGAWDGDSTTERSAVSDALEAELRERGTLDALLDLLVDAVDAAGFDLPATPVPAPPYLSVTGQGPVVRATIEGRRLVVTLRVFAVEGGPRRYRRAGSSAEEVLEVVFRTAEGSR